MEHLSRPPSILLHSLSNSYNPLILMRRDRILNWIIIAIVVLVVILLFNLILGLVVGLARAAIPILIILFVVGLVLRFIGTRRT